jgi:hypothetical protein
MYSAISKNNITIRLTEERWLHITIGHPEMTMHILHIVETVHSPDAVYAGDDMCLIAEKFFRELNNKFVIVVYKEISESDGFIITSFLSKKSVGLKKKSLWKQQN